MELSQIYASPIRKNGGFHDFIYRNSLLDFSINSTPKRVDGDNVTQDFSESLLLTTPTEIRDVSQQCFLSPDLERIRRGRPRAECISTLILEGSVSEGSIRCNICKRIFPREKSLQAHLRTHTGERPYVCNFPGCQRAFCQSGQLKTHQRLHTGEKPFICSVPGCPNRFTHANRHCTDHPMALLKRDSSTKHSQPSCIDILNTSIENEDGMEWLQRNLEQNNTQTAAETPVRPSLLRRQLAVKRSHDSDSDAENRDNELASLKHSKQTIYDNFGDEPSAKKSSPIDAVDQTEIAYNLLLDSEHKSICVETPRKEILKPSSVLNIEQTPIKSTQSMMPNLAQLLSGSCETPKLKVSGEFREKLIGALALIELATSPPRYN